MTPTDFPTIFAVISDRDARKLEETLNQIAAFEAEGVLIKAEFANLKYYISNAMDSTWKKIVFDGFRANGLIHNMSEAEQSLAWDLGHPYPHLIAGYLKKARAFKGDSLMRDAMVRLLEEMLPLSQALDRLKPLIGKRAPKATKTSIARDERDAKAMTCQCCARKILAETGEIAHHGYQRPGSGYQTASCFGALSLPFEVDRERLGALLISLKRQKATLEASLEAMEGEARPLTWSFQDITTKPNAWSKGKTVFHTVTRETFDAVFAQTEAIRAKSHPAMTYDRLKALLILQVESDIRAVVSEIAFQQPRFDGWVQTHKRLDGAWVAL